MRVIVTGWTQWADEEAIRRELRKLPPGTVVIHGDCEGADAIAGRVARAEPAELPAVDAQLGQDRRDVAVARLPPDRVIHLDIRVDEAQPASTAPSMVGAVPASGIST